MGVNLCPTCATAIPSENINISEGVAMCAICGKLSRLSALVEVIQPAADALERTPSGCSVVDRGDEVRIRVSTRCIGSAMAAGFFALFWNGIVSIFVLVAIGGLYTHLIGPLPEWFPAPTFDESLGMSIFLCVFLLPFIGVGLLMLGITLVSLFGSLQVQLKGEKGVVRTGVGPLRWSRRFDAAHVKAVKITKTSWSQNGKHKPLISIECDHTISFGSMLTDRRREWLYALLTELLLSPDAQRGGRFTAPVAPRDFRKP
ncbi:MAG TPA: hypothetical protein PK400_06750 [Phycisphaerales bacterium]|nr:hypothetical protein [Phycisphaerales bacterium]HRQ75984.1 hypothetical protein [Phycisphaerales bacterium]